MENLHDIDGRAFVKVTIAVYNRSQSVLIISTTAASAPADVRLIVLGIWLQQPPPLPSRWVWTLESSSTTVSLGGGQLTPAAEVRNDVEVNVSYQFLQMDQASTCSYKDN